MLQVRLSTSSPKDGRHTIILAALPGTAKQHGVLCSVRCAPVRHRTLVQSQLCLRPDHPAACPQQQKQADTQCTCTIHQCSTVAFKAAVQSPLHNSAVQSFSQLQTSLLLPKLCFQLTSLLLVGHGPRSQSCHGLTPAQRNRSQASTNSPDNASQLLAARCYLTAPCPVFHTQMLQARNPSAAAALPEPLNHLLAWLCLVGRLHTPHPSAQQ